MAKLANAREVTEEMRKVRQAIASNSFAAFREAFLLQLTRERES